MFEKHKKLKAFSGALIFAVIAYPIMTEYVYDPGLIGWLVNRDECKGKTMSMRSDRDFILLDSPVDLKQLAARLSADDGYELVNEVPGYLKIGSVRDGFPMTIDFSPTSSGQVISLSTGFRDGNPALYGAPCTTPSHRVKNAVADTIRGLRLSSAQEEKLISLIAVHRTYPGWW